MIQRKRVLSFFLCVCLCIAILPTVSLSASAVESWFWPVDGVYAMSRGYFSGHYGIDIAASLGTTVRATKSGTVIESANSCPHTNYGSGCSCNGGCGNYVKIKHTDGTYSRYLHLTQGTAIANGTVVSQGDTVGKSGSSGDSTGPHLHFECYNTSNVRINNNPTDPRHTYYGNHDGTGISYVYEVGSSSTTPGKPSLKGFSRSYAHGATTVFNWDSTANTTHYNLYIDKRNSDGSWEVDYKVWHYATSGMTYQFDDGTYRVLLQSTNADASGWPYTNADYITFVVGSHTHDRGAYVFYEADHPHCNCYECSFCGEIWRDTTSSNELDNCYYCQRPGKPALSNFATSYVSGATIVFRWNSVPKATHYNLYIDKQNSDGSWQVDFKYWHYATSGLTTTLDTGTYRVLLQAYNSNFPGEDGTGWAYTNGDYITFVVTPATVTVTFDPNGGSVSPTTKTVTIGSTYGTLPTPTRTYYNFDGWYTSASGGSKVTESTTVTATSNHTLYAHWTHVCANGHNYSYSVSAAPTTSAAGTLTGTCSRCGASTTITLPKLTTNDYNYSIIQAATCTSNGTGRYTWKTTTYGTFSFDVTIPKTGHSYTDTVTPPTCTEQGYTTHTCSRCGDSYQDSYVDALGHSFGAWTQSKAPTCTEKGEEKRICSRCSYTEAREIAATGHNWNSPVYAWADDNGSVTASRTCKNDLSHIEVETVNTTWVVTKEATYDEEGEITYTAAFQNTAFETQTKVVKTPKLEKPDDPKPNPFVDVVEGKYYYNPVLWAYYHDPQITSGTSETTFSPNDTCTRAQIVTFLWRAAGSPEPTTTNNPFSDVKADKYYYKAVLWAAETGVTSGTSETTFSPNDGCTRAQVVTFLWRFAGSPEPTTSTNPFEDVPDGKYYTKAVLWAAEKGVTAGTSETTFSPNDTCTRGQIVTFLYRYMQG